MASFPLSDGPVGRSLKGSSSSGIPQDPITAKPGMLFARFCPILVHLAGGGYRVWGNVEL